MGRIIQLLKCAPLTNLIEYSLAKVKKNGCLPEDEHIKGEKPYHIAVASRREVNLDI